MGLAFLTPVVPLGVGQRSILRSSSTTALRPRRGSQVAQRRSSILLSNTPKDDDSKNSDVDWDSSWKTFQKEGSEGKTVRREVRTNNVFQLPVERRPDNDIVDERTNKLTSAWTSESGYLIGIAIIAVIACLEGYVWWQSQQ